MSFVENLMNINGKGVIRLMGAGGKITLMFQLAGTLQKANKKILTTTTKIFMPPPCQYAISLPK